MEYTCNGICLNNLSLTFNASNSSLSRIHPQTLGLMHLCPSWHGGKHTAAEHKIVIILCRNLVFLLGYHIGICLQSNPLYNHKQIGCMCLHFDISKFRILLQLKLLYTHKHQVGRMCLHFHTLENTQL